MSWKVLLSFLLSNHLCLVDWKAKYDAVVAKMDDMRNVMQTRIDQQDRLLKLRAESLLELTAECEQHKKKQAKDEDAREKFMKSFANKLCHELKQKYDALEKQVEQWEAHLCCICQERPSNRTFTRCGHTNYCDTCLPRSVTEEKCPICNQRGPLLVIYTG